ncbi:MAG: ComEC/Rec2 family competence protein [Paracoccus sp. (in: a-proteobacteria)]|uniref:ComEC/Rec2 family competence protein n=1 Tax=Paracoccus sp. TaxID=267 RepID=UPI0039E237DD
MRVSLGVRAGLLPWIPFWLALGIGAWFWPAQEPGAVAYALAGGAGLAGLAAWLSLPRLAYRVGSDRAGLGWAMADRLRLLGLAAAVVALGFTLIGLRAWSVADPVLSFRYYGPVEGRVIGIDRSAGDRLRLTLDRVTLGDLAPGKLPKRVRISLFLDDPLPVPGQQVMLTAHLGPPNGPAEPGGFDFRRMAWFEGLGAIGYSRTPVMTVAPPRPGGVLALHRLRMHLGQVMRDAIGGQSGAVAAALMTGDRSGISERTNDIMRASNLYHIISISGLHMSMLAGFVYAGLRLICMALQGLGLFAGSSLHKPAALGALAAAGIYLWLSGGGVATERSFIMVAVMLLAILADRRAVSLRTVAAAAALVLLYQPEALTSAGFQMSFAATVALILSQGPWLRLSPALPWWLRPLAMLLVSSLIASLVTTPLAAAHFGRGTQYGLLANLLVVPVVGSVVMPAGVIAALLALLGLAQPALWVMGLGVDWMLWVADWIAGLHGAVYLVKAPPRIVLPMIGIGAMLVVLAPAGIGHGDMSRLPFRRLAGAGLVLLALGVWGATPRPLMLISSEGDGVAIMTPLGRVPSKARGGAFATAEWLEADGDAADQRTAAARPLWSGPPGGRSARLQAQGRDVTIQHLTGKKSAPLAASLCDAGTILVSDQPLVLGGRPACLLLDQRALARRGAVAIVPTGTGYLVRDANGVSRRLWTRGKDGR